MTIGHIVKNPRPFKPSLRGGGSKVGKPQGKWPLIILVVAHAVVIRSKGSSDSWNVDRSAPMPLVRFKELMEQVLPGVWEWAEVNLPERVTPYEKLLYNRVYKMYYSGTSARGKNHNPFTRGTQSPEHWTNSVPVGSPLRFIHEQIERSLIPSLPNWRDYLAHRHTSDERKRKIDNSTSSNGDVQVAHPRL